MPGDLPVAVEVQHVAGDVPLADAPGPFQHALLAVREEARRDPGAERPSRRQVRPSGQRVEPVEHPLRGGPGQHVVVEQVVRDEDLHAAVGARAHVELHRQSAVDEDAVAAVGQVERHVLVRAVGLAAERVEVPHQRSLAALVQRRELLAEADEPFVAGCDEALVPGDRLAVDCGAAERQRAAATADVPGAAVGGQQQPTVGGEEAQPPRVQAHLGDHATGTHPDAPVGDSHRGRVRLRVDQRQCPCGPAADREVVGEAYPDDPFPGGLDARGERAAGRADRGERDAVRVGRGDLGPQHVVGALLAGGADRQVGRVGHERLVRDQRRAVRHGRLLAASTGGPASFFGSPTNCQ